MKALLFFAVLLNAFVVFASISNASPYRQISSQTEQGAKHGGLPGAAEGLLYDIAGGAGRAAIAMGAALIGLLVAAFRKNSGQMVFFGSSFFTLLAVGSLITIIFPL